MPHDGCALWKKSFRVIWMIQTSANPPSFSSPPLRLLEEQEDEKKRRWGGTALMLFALPKRAVSVTFTSFKKPPSVNKSITF